MYIFRAFTFFYLIMSVLCISCEEFLPSAPAEDSLLDGPVQELSHEQQASFLAGDIAFNDDIFTVDKGLGPMFVATSCGTCHAGDGKGHLFTTLTRYGQTDSTGNKFLDRGGPQLQNRAIPGYKPEILPSGASFSRFTPPAVTGLGFLAAVTDVDILAMADPDDRDGDGISGVPNFIKIPEYVTPSAQAITKNGRYIGRFGKKAATFNLLHQTAVAYNEDMGITSVFEPVDTYSGQSMEPEVSTATIHHVVFYLNTLKAPIQRNPDDPVVQEGKRIFVELGCDGCHKPSLTTGPSTIEALSDKLFHPYTDLLLHDMGPDLDDGYTEGTAKASEWRTPPLWGLGLSENSQGGEYFLLHDGRARSIEEAILWHGGEGAVSRNAYQALGPQEKQKLLTFLKSL